MLKTIIKKNNIPMCKKQFKIKRKSYYSFQTARNKLRDEYKYHEKNLPSWFIGDISSRIIDGAIQTCTENYINNIKKVQEDHISSFKLKYKTKKEILSTILLTKDVFSRKTNSFLLKYLGQKIKSSISFKGKITKDVRLQYNKVLGTFDLVIPYDKRSDKQTPLTDVIALDPGSRTFLTGYSPKFHLLEIGKNISPVCRKIKTEVNIVKSNMSKILNKKKQASLRKVIHRKNKRLQNLRDELHWKAIKFLTTHYNTIMLGDLSTQSISSKKNKLNRNSKNDFSFLSMFKFKKRLEEKCLDNGNDFLFIDESFTTRTCTKCGKINDKKKEKIITCSKCNFETDRDFQGARNIYLKGWFQLSEWEIHPLI
jgi:IS605 OrfB family transposase